MSIKSILARPFARLSVALRKRYTNAPLDAQKQVFRELIASARDTAFGRDHDFSGIRTYEDFKSRVPIRDYEELKPYVERVKEGERDVLWPGLPAYFAKTSGTTSGVKYIPITAVSMKEQVKSSKLALLQYIVNKKSAAYVDGKMIFLQGSPVLDTKGAVKTGRLSGISAHYLPKYLLKNRLPSWETNVIEDWETKVEAIVSETIDQNMTLIAGIPSWVQMYFERLQARSGKRVGELFPNFSLYVYGGVNFEPYRQKFEDLIGRRVDSIELFPASEGFFAYQDSLANKGLLLQVHSG
ncbi:MAG: GH3 auxin-responsive promoter family protein, partial [Bacteroidetes bacterium]|nr:GH3 auxin-responsive promoter family protein [Bacteroidota bacterium]